MLAEREAHIRAEEWVTGQPSTWEHVYELMRCNVRSCPHKSDWCWEDPKDKKHYKLRTPYLERLIDYVDEGGILDGYGDVPTGLPYPPTIVNVLPAQNGNAPVITSSLPRPLSEERLIIAGPRESAVREYCRWLESRATEDSYKADFRKICQVTLENHLDLEMILGEPDSGFFVQRGIRIGTARRFLRDINEWAAAMKSNKLL
ncbi:hypothetical protein PENSOL_c019G02971 [Penicillium solitum]|uniref:Uncharacterized protein n=1 Tax=Penicillium solitum TaxID=60172 RepID=A0A1V6R2P2_9EURO|nr:uncharacterized protein PENSOL_c019G02971 [Penicillium solitum]OQD95750.1 hypothetical protein PENSOL_c019G02971 [Penicillium solitum]